MGLDMYMSGRKFFVGYPAKDFDEEGHEIEEIRVRLAYWRKHANLHGYIVATFAEGADNCQDIELSIEQLHEILEVVKKPDEMPKTEGFFFGESMNDEQQIEEDVELITKCIAFLSAPAVVREDHSKIWRSVIYRASW